MRLVGSPRAGRVVAAWLGAAVAGCLGSLGAGCACAVAPFATDGSVGASDAPPPGTLDGSADAGLAQDAWDAVSDTLGDRDTAVNVDAWVEADSSFDCSSCAVAPDCTRLNCASSCDYAQEADGVGCGAGVCLSGACEARRCGDGWRERGDTGLPREECDDGNDVSGDGCSDVCMSEVVVLDAETGRSTELPAIGYPAAGVDDDGNVAIAWTEDSLTALPRLVMRRFDASGAAIDLVPIELDTLPSAERAAATVQGLASGWVVAWRSSTVDPAAGFDVAYRLVPVAGTPGAARVANGAGAYSQRYPTIARIDSGFVIGWMTPSAPAVVSARLFGPDGAPAGAELVVVPRDTLGRSFPFLVGRGGNAWTAGFMESRTTKLEMRGIARLREFSGGAATSGAFDVLSGGVVVELVLGRTETGVVVGGLDALGAGTPRARWIADGTMPVDDSDVVSYGTAGTESDLAVAAVGDDAWFAVYRAPMSSDGAVIETSPGLPPLPELDTLRADFVSQAFEERFSIAPFDDGWWIAWTSFDGAESSVRALRVSRPAL